MEKEQPEQILSEEEMQDKYLTEEEKAFGRVLDHIGKLIEAEKVSDETKNMGKKHGKKT